MYIKLKNDALNLLKDSLNSLNYPIPDEVKFEEPPNPKMGDLATTISFQLAKELKKSPMDITNEIIDILTPKIDEVANFEKIESKGPYINFFINYNNFSRDLINSIDDNYGNNFKINNSINKDIKITNKKNKIILEHTSANPNGPLHVGHLRNAIIGDSLGRVLKAAGEDVETQYYVNDMGRQIAIVVFGLTKLKLPFDENSTQKKDHQIGELYYKANTELNENSDYSAIVGNLIKSYESDESEELNKTFEKAVNDCLDGMKETLTNINVKHDNFVWEGTFVRNGDVDKVVEDLIATGRTSLDEVLQLNLEEFNIEKELVLRRSDGTSLYSTRDLAYHNEKSKNADFVIDVLGADHKLAVDQISGALELLNEKVPEVVFYEFMTLPEGSMSTRRGVFISIDDLINETTNRATEEIKKRRTDLTKTQIADIAHEIAIGAIRYYIAKISPEKHVVFKWDEALSFERGCASIQYAHARASKLLENTLEIESENNKNNLKIEEKWVPNETEIELIRILAKLPELVLESAKLRRVHHIAQYSQDLASAFNKFYKTEQVIGYEFESARLLIVEKSKIAIKNSLELLGVVAPEIM
ncbi:MAG: arginine--tRNA ligase [Methanobacteriaceae archaeon]